MGCSVEGCDRPVNGLGFCHMHYRRFRKHGSAEVVLRAGGKRMRRFPASPLLELVARRWPDQTDDRTAVLLGVTGPKLWEWRRDGLSWSAADRAAVAIGFHPLSIWPDWCDDVEGAA